MSDTEDDKSCNDDAALADLTLEGLRLEARILNGCNLSDMMVLEYLRLHGRTVRIRAVSMHRENIRQKLDGFTRYQLLAWLQTLRYLTDKLTGSSLDSSLAVA